MNDFVREAAARLRSAGVGDAEHDARRLAAWAAGLDAAGLVLHGSTAFDDPAVRTRFEGGVARRVAREPLQWIEGGAAFCDFTVAVGEGALVPRPETEVTALAAIERLPGGGRALDCGTGTGVLAIALARADPTAEVHATERAAPALVWAARNLERLAPSVVLHQGWYLAVDGDFDLVVANPPYVDTAEWEGLEPEVRDHDPKTALVPQTGDGLADIALLVREVPARLRPRGAFVCEIGATQGDTVAALAVDAGFKAVEIRADLAGRPRVLIATI